mgnify:CR=1 FL=1
MLLWRRDDEFPERLVLRLLRGKVRLAAEESVARFALGAPWGAQEAPSERPDGRGLQGARQVQAAPLLAPEGRRRLGTGTVDALEVKVLPAAREARLCSRARCRT